MGCFSWMCLESGEPIASDSYSGDAVVLFLMKKGHVIESMVGNYNSYGAVFNDIIEGTSFEWNMPWGQVCDLMFNEDEDSGIAAIKLKYWDGMVPSCCSEDDPDQGWHDFENDIVPEPNHYVPHFLPLKTIEKQIPIITAPSKVNNNYEI